MVVASDVCIQVVVVRALNVQLTCVLRMGEVGVVYTQVDVTKVL